MGEGTHAVFEEELGLRLHPGGRGVAEGEGRPGADDFQHIIDVRRAPEVLRRHRRVAQPLQPLKVDHLAVGVQQRAGRRAKSDVIGDGAEGALGDGGGSGLRHHQSAQGGRVQSCGGRVQLALAHQPRHVLLRDPLISVRGGGRGGVADGGVHSREAPMPHRRHP